MSTAARASARASRVSSRLAKILLCSCKGHKTERGAGRGGQGGAGEGGREGAKRGEGEGVGLREDGVRGGEGGGGKSREESPGGERGVGKVGVIMRGGREPAAVRACKGVQGGGEPSKRGKWRIAGDSTGEMRGNRGWGRIIGGKARRGRKRRKEETKSGKGRQPEGQSEKQRTGV